MGRMENLRDLDIREMEPADIRMAFLIVFGLGAIVGAFAVYLIWTLLGVI